MLKTRLPRSGRGPRCREDKARDKTLRHLYIDLLVLSGDYERADAQCDVAARFEATDGLGYALLRREIRAMAARAEWYDKAPCQAFPRPRPAG